MLTYFRVRWVSKMTFPNLKNSLPSQGTPPKWDVTFLCLNSEQSYTNIKKFCFHRTSTFASPWVHHCPEIFTQIFSLLSASMCQHSTMFQNQQNLFHLWGGSVSFPMGSRPHERLELHLPVDSSKVTTRLQNTDHYSEFLPHLGKLNWQKEGHFRWQHDAKWVVASLKPQYIECDKHLSCSAKSTKTCFSYAARWPISLLLLLHRHHTDVQCWGRSVEAGALNHPDSTDLTSCDFASPCLIPSFIHTKSHSIIWWMVWEIRQ